MADQQNQKNTETELTWRDVVELGITLAPKGMANEEETEDGDEQTEN